MKSEWKDVKINTSEIVEILRESIKEAEEEADTEKTEGILIGLKIAKLSIEYVARIQKLTEGD